MKIGLGQVDYTPPAGLPLMGHFRKDYQAKGVHDPLYGRAVVLQDSSGKKLALLSVDICMMDRIQVAMMREFITGQSDIPAGNILIASTHIHTGPATASIYGLPKAPDHEVEAFLKKAASAVLLANQNLTDGSLHVGYSSESRVSFNRRLLCKDNKTHMNWEELDPDFVVEPLGPIDPQVTCLFVEQDDHTRGAIVNFSLHPAILDQENSLYSAGYPGYLAQANARLFGPDFETIFFNGCCGNVNHLDYSDPPRTRGYKVCQLTGYSLAVAVQEAWRSRVPIGNGDLAVSTQMVPLKRLRITEQQRQWAEQALQKAGGTAPLDDADGLPPEYCAAIWLQMYEKQNSDDAVEVMAIRVGNLAIVGLPGEVFCELGLDLKKSSPAEHTIVIELANDSVGYLPTVESFAQGGYETSMGSTKYEKGSSEKIITASLEQLNRLFE